MDEIKKKKILKMLSKSKKENPKNPGVSTKELEENVNMEYEELESYIRDLKWRGYIEYDGSETFNGQDVQITSKGEKNIRR
jgi:predicted transcriptional regulator